MAHVFSQENTGSQLVKLIQKSKELSTLDTILKSHLSHPLADHCHVANFVDGTLHVTVDSNSWATQIRFMARDLVKQLNYQPAFKALKKIRYRVVPTTEAVKKPKTATKKTATAKAAITSCKQQLMD